MLCWWCRKTETGPKVCIDDQTIALCGSCARIIADFLPTERTPDEPFAVVPGDGAHPEALRAPAFLASEVLTLRAAITRLTAENEKLIAKWRKEEADEAEREAREHYHFSAACLTSEFIGRLREIAAESCERANELAALAAPRAPQEPV